MADMENEDGIMEECAVCGGVIYIDAECEEEDLVYCNDCEAEFMIRSLSPLRLIRVDGDEEGGNDYEDEDE